MTFFVQALLACFTSALLIVWMKRPAQRFGLLDHAGGRKRHGASVPLTGGLAIAVSLLLNLLVSSTVLALYGVLLVSLGLLVAIGLLDDLGEVSPRAKMGVQLIAALFMTSWAGLYLINLGDIVMRGPFLLRNWGIPLTVFATVAVINGLNMLDGLDGLAGGLAFCVLGFFALFTQWLGDSDGLKFLVVLLGALAGFLWFNAPHGWRGSNRTFMGDTGSLVLGFVMAWFAVSLSQRPGPHVPPIVMVWVCSVVLLDLLTVTLRRVIRRRDPALPDRGHVHHVLLRRGFTAREAVLFLLACNLGLGLTGVAIWKAGVPDAFSFMLFGVVTLAYLWLFLYPSRLLRLNRGRRMARPAPPPEA